MDHFWAEPKVSFCRGHVGPRPKSRLAGFWRNGKVGSRGWVLSQSAVIPDKGLYLIGQQYEDFPCLAIRYVFLDPLVEHFQ